VLTFVTDLDGGLDLGLESVGRLEEAAESEAGVLPEPVELEQRLPLQHQVRPGQQVLLLQQRVQHLSNKTQKKTSFSIFLNLKGQCKVMNNFLRVLKIK
jgi:hypothetical protein